MKERLTNDLNPQNDFLTSITEHLMLNGINYVISNSNGMYPITNMDINSNEPRYTTSLSGMLQSVAAQGGRQIIGELTTDDCIPLISHIGKNKYVITTPFNGINVSHITTLNINKKDINSIDTIYSQTCDASGRFISDELEEPKINQKNTLTKLKIQKDVNKQLTDEKPNQTSILLTNVASIHAARDGALNEAKISIAEDATLYIPVIKNGKYYLIISEKIPINDTYHIKTKIQTLEDSTIHESWKNQKTVKAICDIAKKYKMIKNN